MKKLALLTLACMIIAFGSLARAQQIDLAIGDSTLFSSKPTTASQAYLPPAEKGGAYPYISAEFFFKNHFGVNAEAAVRYNEGLYNGYQRFRPVLYDVNAAYASRLGTETSVDLMAGVGAQSLIFYNKFATCNFASCPMRVSSTHFLGHVGGGVRYYFLGHFFVRPEVHYYFVRNNSEFHSNNVFRAGASIGYTFGR